MSFQVGIVSLGGTLFFQVGLCTPLQTMTSFSFEILLNSNLQSLYTSFCWLVTDAARLYNHDTVFVLFSVSFDFRKELNINARPQNLKYINLSDRYVL